MNSKRDNPGVYVPPPLFYVAVFFLSLFLQKVDPVNDAFFQSAQAKIAGMFLIITALVFLIPALTRFIQSKNTLVTIKPANSLQTSGIYRKTRNPMYVGLLLLYTGIAFLKGDWWTIMLIPVVIIIVQSFVIRKEEAYLTRAFGNTYLEYRKKVRRWI